MRSLVLTAAIVAVLLATPSMSSASANNNNDKIKARLQSLVDWTRNETQQLEVVRQDVVDDDEEEPHCPANHDEGKMKHFPSADDAGVEEKLLRLCATVAGGVYKTTSKRDFEKILKDNEEIGRAFPDLTLRFYQTGTTLGRLDSKSKASLNAPTLAGVIVENTLVLAYRGTTTLADMVADLRISSIQPWKNYPGLEVQGAFYNLVRDSYFGNKRIGHQKDIINYIRGNYSRVPNKTAKDGTPIKRIVLTGHSLGGGLAQVTHLCLTADGERGPFRDVAEAIRSHGVEVRTVAFSAPMTTALADNLAPQTTAYLRDTIQPNMRNFCYKTDPVPRGYANIVFMLDLLDDIKEKFMAARAAAEDDNYKRIQTMLRFLKEGLLPWAVEYLEGKIENAIEQAKRYRHVGKIIYYDKECAGPETYVDYDKEDDEEAAKADGTTSFRDLLYTPSSEDPITEAIEFHMFLVKERGLGYL